jgi:secreted Zn-dependent insulinase-like peptidase
VLLLTPIDPALSLPAANPFIPDELNLKTAKLAPEQATPAYPELIQQNSGLDLWHQLDTSFNVPRSNLYIALQSPIANKTPKDSLLTALLTGIIKKQLNSYAYPAHLAGLSYSVYATERGMSIVLSGYDQKQSFVVISGALMAAIICSSKTDCF